LHWFLGWCFEDDPEPEPGVESHVVAPRNSHRTPPRNCESSPRISTSAVGGTIRPRLRRPHRHHEASASVSGRVKGRAGHALCARPAP
jgi:hypothetical protein